VLWKALKQVFRRINIELPHVPTILLLGTYTKELRSDMPTDTCTPVFMAKLFITAKDRKNPTILLTCIN
jgi:hypothetical protein